MQKLRGVFLILLSSFAYGTMPIFIRMAYDAGADPVSVLFFRFLIAGVLLLVILLRQHKPWPRKNVFLGLVAMGAIGFVGQSFTYYNALALASTNLVVLVLYLYPVLVSLFGVLFFGEKISSVKLVALLLAVTGGVLTVGTPGGGQPLGILLAFSATTIYSFYILFGNQLMQKTSALTASTVILLSAGVVYTLLILVSGLNSPQTMPGWIGVLGVALVSTVLAVVTFFMGLEQVGAINAAALSTFEPVTAIVLSAIIFGDQLSAVRLAGGALILCAVILLARFELKRKPLPQPAD